MNKDRDEEGEQPNRRREADEGEIPARSDLVLLVDDDPVARLLTASALAESNWRVIEADGGAHALELFSENQPDVVVLDALMPDIDGFITCERLRRLSGGEHVPVLMLTGLDDEPSIARAYEAGATDFFVKSTTQWQVSSAIGSASAVRGRRIGLRRRQGHFARGEGHAARMTHEAKLDRLPLTEPTAADTRT